MPNFGFEVELIAKQTGQRPCLTQRSLEATLNGGLP